MLHKLVPISFCLVLFCSVSHAQITLDAKTKLLILTTSIEASGQMLAEGKVGMARYALLSATSIYQRLYQQLPEEIHQQFDAACLAAWPEPITDDNVGEVLTNWQKAIDEYNPKLTGYALKLDFFQPHDSMDFEQWANYVLEARQVQAEAEACAAEYCSACPPPMIHLTDAGSNLGAFDLLYKLHIISLGQVFADEYAKSDILPRSLEKAPERLAEVPGACETPHVLIMASDDVRQLASFILQVEPTNEKGLEYLRQADTLTDKANELYAKHKAENRMPGENYNGPDTDELHAQMLTAVEEAWENEKALQVAITGETWVERAEAWWEGDVIKSGVFRTINASVACRNDNGDCQVFMITFTREWTGIGDDFGRIYLARNRGSYPMLEENL